MRVASYLPSQQFSFIVVSVALSAGLILGAKYYTEPHNTSNNLSTTEPTQETDWQSALDAVQATAPGLPDAPSEDVVNEFLEASQSDNLTSSVARSLFINLSTAKSQGLGGDIPTQDQLVATAASQATKQEAPNAYTLDDIRQVSQDSQSQKAYGNAVMRIMTSNPKASVEDTYIYLAQVTDTGDQKSLERIGDIGDAYTSLARQLSEVSVPTTLAPLHVKVVNDFAAAGTALHDVEKLATDPLLALQGLQNYQALQAEAARVLTTLAEQLRKNGILFTKDEPGSAWSVFLSS